MSSDLEPYYRSGVSGVSHRNIDAAGDGHPFGSEPKEWKADLRPLIRQVADDLYESWGETVREYLANAETACLKVEHFLESPDESPFDEMIVDDTYEPLIEVTWDRSEQKLIIEDNGIGMAGVEVDQVVRHIGRSASREFGWMSGAFGLGVLSFPKFIGSNNTMVMLSHSRLNDDNAAYLITLAGIEPVMGQLDEDKYGTKFKLDQKSSDMRIRETVAKFSEYARVPIIYREYDENGTEVFNEDWGDMKLYDKYDESSYATSIIVEGAFAAYNSEDATGETLLLSMPINRNASEKCGAPNSIDIRILDESGRIVFSDDGNEGLIPVPRDEYEQMLREERSDSITDGMLSTKDTVGLRIESDSDTKTFLVESSVPDERLPSRYEYVSGAPTEDATDERVVLSGPNAGRTIVSEDEWDSLPEGRASEFIPEDELEDGDICLPTPTTDRSTLQENEAFWDELGDRFNKKFDDEIVKTRSAYGELGSNLEAVREMEPRNKETMEKL